MQAQLLETESKFTTRFGEVSFDEANAIAFPNGILGMPNQSKFFVARFPGSKMEGFSVLQSLVDTQVAFATLPILPSSTLIDGADIAEVSKVLEIAESDLLVTLIVSIQKTPSGSRLSVNLRAPVFIDTAQKRGYQIVLANPKYPVQHFLG